MAFLFLDKLFHKDLKYIYMNELDQAEFNRIVALTPESLSSDDINFLYAQSPVKEPKAK